MEGSGGIPLQRYEVFDTTDIDEARDQVARIFRPHRLEPARRHHRLHVRQTAASLRRLTLSYIEYGDDVRIIPGELDTIFLVQMPLAGRAKIACGHQSIVAVPGLAAVPSASEPLAMDWKGDSRQLVLRVERPALEAHLENLLHRTLHDPIRFQLGMDLTSAEGQSWMNLIGLLQAELDRQDGLARSNLVGAELEQLLLTALLVIQPNNYSAALLAQNAPAVPRAVRRAIELMESEPDQPYTVGDLARAAGVSVRSLQDGFQRSLRTSPTAYLRQVRLERVRRELARAAPGDGVTVTEVASRWGFFHLGHFSTSYRQRFGESPSETLRR